MSNTIQLGVIEGKGTGKEVISYFKDVITEICHKENKATPTFISFLEHFDYCLDSYYSMLERGYFYPSLEDQVSDIEHFFDILYKNNAIGAFQSAINAEALYNFRFRKKFLKYLPFIINKNNDKKEILFIRDMCQGFYANNKVEKKLEKVSFESSFLLDNFVSICKFIKNKISNEQHPDEIIFIYKYHLFEKSLEDMIFSACDFCGFGKDKVCLMQPDTGIQYLFDKIWQNKVQSTCVVCGNEVGDMLLEMLGYYYGIGDKESLFSVNYSINNPSLELLQTVHGSADNLEGSNKLDPTPLMNLSAYALQNWLDVKGAVDKMTELIKQEKQKPFMGTQSQVESILSYW